MSHRFVTPGDFSWTELMTHDIDAAKAFYRAVLRWELEDVDMPSGPYTTIKAGGEQVGGMLRMPGDVPAGTPPHWAAYVTVQDVDATAARIRQNGGTVLVAPTDIPSVGRFCTFRDPQGAILSVISYVPIAE
ncbi:VOC family protein [Candidatus Bipolaricaulota bacterium]|nr:VOC family protein [Candidatus Bipolaricaulota bacterium]